MYANVDIFDAIEDDMKEIIQKKSDYNARTGRLPNFVNDYDNFEMLDIPEISFDKYTEPRYVIAMV